MIIEENQLRPPSPKEMQARYVPLERITINWQYDCWDDTFCRHNGVHDSTTPKTIGIAYSDAAGFTTLELIEFHKQWAIPYEAFMVNYGYEGEKALDWTHLNRCPICQEWYLEGSDHIRDAMHVAVSRAKTATSRLLKDENWVSDGGICT